MGRLFVGKDVCLGGKILRAACEDESDERIGRKFV
jgi:hypothetical protein